MNKSLEIFIVGTGILVTAIIINFLADAMGIATWYSFLSDISENGLINTLDNQWLHLIFLIIIYPLVLGTVAYYLLQFLERLRKKHD